MARYLFRRVVSWGRSSNVFLENGARLYLDVGSHPEYATPECDSLHDLVAHDKAGERILEGLVRSAEQRLEEEGIRGQIYLFKNNTDSAGNSYGCHENYLVSRHSDFQRMVDTLIPFLVSRQIFSGAGKLLQTAWGTMFSLSQRAEHIWEGISSATTRSRPIINTRDEPHADAERYRRLHVIAGDSNMSEYATYVKVGTVAALLQMLEDGVVFRDLTLENPIRGSGRSATTRPAAPGATGQRAGAVGARHPVGVPRPGDALQPLRRVPRRGARAAGDVGAPAHRVGEGPAQPGPRGGLGDQAPPGRAVQTKWAVPMSHPGLAMLDLSYHDVMRDRGVYHLLAKRGLVDLVVTDHAIERARPTRRRRRPGPGCGASSSKQPRPRSVTSPSTGSISSSTTRRSAPCCARTRSKRLTSGWRS